MGLVGTAWELRAEVRGFAEEEGMKASLPSFIHLMHPVSDQLFLECLLCASAEFLCMNVLSNVFLCTMFMSDV